MKCGGLRARGVDDGEDEAKELWGIEDRNTWEMNGRVEGISGNLCLPRVYYNGAVH